MAEPPLLRVPLADPTTEVVADRGRELLDLNRRFVERVAGPGELRALAARLDVRGAGDGAAERCLLALASAAIVAGRPAGVTWLRALGAALRAFSAADPAVAARLDDVELRDGTVQRSADVERAARRAELFDPELRAAAEAIERSGGASLVVDVDQQLVAAVRLRSMAPSCPIALTGRYAARHREALSRMPALAGVRFEEARHRHVVRRAWLPDPAASAEPVRWVTRGDRPPAAGPWMGWLDGEDAGAIGAETLGRCLGLVVTLARLPSWHAAVGAHGATVDLTDAACALAARVPVAVELLVGAPGVDRSELEQAVELVAASRARLAGFRPFLLPADSRGPGWGPAGDADPSLDLAQWTVDDRRWGRAAARALLAELLADAVERHELFPGRVAGALGSREEWRPLGDGRAWDPAAAVVATAHVAPPGSAPGAFLVSLRTGRIARVPGPLATMLSGLVHGGDDARRLLAGLGAARREALWRMLLAAGVARSAGTPP